MAFSQFTRKTAWCWLLILGLPGLVHGQSGYVPQANQYPIAGLLPGDQVYPAVSLKPGGGYLVWQDNRTDGDGQGISALRLDTSFSAPLASFRVNSLATADQARATVSLLNGGGAAFVWQGGKLGFQDIYARFLSSTNTWLTSDVLVNTFTNNSQISPAVATLTNGQVIVIWASFNQETPTSLQGVYAQRFTATGLKQGNEFQINQTTAFNQRTPVIAPLSDGRFVVAWVSEQQRFENSVDIYARFFDATGAAVGNEFLVNTGTNVCANPSIAASSDGGFTVTWGQKDLVVLSDNWDVFARPFSGSGFGGIVRRVNTTSYGDQYGPIISSVGTDYMVVWTSLGQDGSREGVYGQFLRGDGSLAGPEMRVNTTTVSQQMFPTLASDGNGRFLAVWTSFVGGGTSFDLFAQRYVSTNSPLYPPDRPYVTVLSSNALGVTWPKLAGFNVANWEVYADGAGTATVSVSNNMWVATGLTPNSTHSYRLAYVLADGRRSPISIATTNTTYRTGTHGGIPRDWMILFFGDDSEGWPSAGADTDGDGASNRDEYRQGTDPTDPNSVLRAHLGQTQQGMFLYWNTQPGLIYQVEETANFAIWSKLGLPRFAAGYEDSVFVGIGGTRYYYRIVRVQ